MKLKAEILTKEDVNRTLVRLSHQIVEKNGGTDGICLIGIKRRGIPMAQRIAGFIKDFENADIPVGELDITLYRDDLSQLNIDPVVNQTNIPFDIEGKTVVLVDDVIFTGRTIRAALDALFAIGRPKKVQACVLVDRGHSELPIKANFVGKNIPTSLHEVISVNMDEVDGFTNVEIFEI